jgi:hypothetical protein
MAPEPSEWGNAEIHFSENEQRADKIARQEIAALRQQLAELLQQTATSTRRRKGRDVSPRTLAAAYAVEMVLTIAPGFPGQGADLARLAYQWAKDNNREHWADLDPKDGVLPTMAATLLEARREGKKARRR